MIIALRFGGLRRRRSGGKGRRADGNFRRHAGRRLVLAMACRRRRLRFGRRRWYWPRGWLERRRPLATLGLLVGLGQLTIERLVAPVGRCDTPWKVDDVRRGPTSRSKWATTGRGDPEGGPPRLSHPSRSCDAFVHDYSPVAVGPRTAQVVRSIDCASGAHASFNAGERVGLSDADRPDERFLGFWGDTR